MIKMKGMVSYNIPPEFILRVKPGDNVVLEITKYRGDMIEVVFGSDKLYLYDSHLFDFFIISDFID